jgi:hypothetical protein
MKKYISIAVFAFLSSAQSQAQEWRGVATMADLFLWRPVSFAGTIVGGALWIVSLPVTLPSKTHADTLDMMVKKPYQWTFERPLPDVSD